MAEYQRINSWFVWPEKDFPRTSTQKPRTNLIQQTVQAEMTNKASDHGIAGPLRELTRATGRIGHGAPVRVPEIGPDETRGIGRALNASLEAVLRLERFLVRRGLSFPVGGSLLLVARKRATSPLVPLYASTVENERT